jgi:dTMP kinase
MSRGRLITLEGGEGSGKSTQASALAAALARNGIDVWVTREPGGTPGGERIRRLLIDGEARDWTPVAEALLHYAARREHVEKAIEPALAGGRWVVCDRFSDSTMAYQGYAQGLGRERVEELHRLAIGELRPDLTVMLDVPIELGLARSASRGSGGTRYERMGRDFHSRIRAAFMDIARREPERCAIVDAAQAVEEVTEAICSEVMRRFNLSAVE